MHLFYIANNAFAFCIANKVASFFTNSISFLMWKLGEMEKYSINETTNKAIVK